jgi:hypothetical protein
LQDILLLGGACRQHGECISGFRHQAADVFPELPTLSHDLFGMFGMDCISKSSSTPWAHEEYCEITLAAPMPVNRLPHQILLQEPGERFKSLYRCRSRSGIDVQSFMLDQPVQSLA